MKRIIRNVSFFVPLSVLVCACGGETTEKTLEKETLELLVELEEIKSKTFTHEIKVQGNVETDEDVMLTAEMGGLITQLEYANYMLQKQEELNERNVGSEFELESAKNRVESLEASIQSLTTQQGKATIKAPFSGTIDQVFAKKGQMAGPASPVVRLVNNHDVDITAMISEKHLANIKVGTPIRVTFPNYAGHSINLEITSVGNYIEPTNRTFRITANVPKNDVLLPNMLAEVHITDLQVDEGLVISSKAILKDQNSVDFVYTAKKSSDGKFKVSKTNIEVLAQFEGRALIAASEKIKKGKMVVIEGARGITNGDIVTNRITD